MTRMFIFLFIFPLVHTVCPPETTYESSFNKCYIFFEEALSFLLAEEKCQAIGGHLVEIQNGFENAYVSGFVAASVKSISYWIGANYLLSSQWSYTTNKPVYYTNWAPQQPLDPSPQQCAAVRDLDTAWTKELCNTDRSFVCTVDPNAPSPTSCSNPSLNQCPDRSSCSSGYTFYKGDCRCYKYVSGSRTIYDSNTRCNQDGATLVKILSQEQNDFLVKLAGPYGCDGGCPFIGLFCPVGSVENCMWYDGTYLTGYSNFNNYSRGGTESVFMYVSSYETGKWSEWSPGFTGSTFCSKPAISSMKPKKESYRTDRIYKRI